MSGPVNVRDLARRDIADRFLSISESSQSAALRFRAAVEQTLELLRRMPGIGELYPSARAELTGVRRFHITGFRNLVIYYRVCDDVVEIMRVLHAARGDVDPLLQTEVPDD